MKQKNTSTLVIWWPSTSKEELPLTGNEQLLTYKVISNTGLTVDSGEQTLSQLPKNLPCLILVHPNDLLLLTITPPKASGKKLKQALPFIAEPLILNDPEQNFFKLWPNLFKQESADKALLSVISKKAVQKILTICDKHALTVSTLSNELLLDCSQPCVWLSNNWLFINDQIKPPSAFALDQIDLIKPIIQKRLLSELNSNVPPHFFVSQKDYEMFNSYFPEHLKPVDNQSFRPGLHTLLQNPLVDPEDLKSSNLGGSRKKTQSDPLSIWKPIYALCLVLVIGLNLLAHKVNQQEEQLNNEIKTTFKRVMPNTPMAADPLLLMQQRKRQLEQGQAQNSGQNFANFFHQVAISLEHLPFNSLEALQWQENQLRLIFSDNVTKSMQDQATRTLDTRSISGRWVQNKKDQSLALVIQQERN